jgi:hypothetical protein
LTPLNEQIGQLFTGIAVEGPKNLDPHDRTRTEDIGPEHTGEADFGRLLERAYDKTGVGDVKCVRGLASPAGAPTVVSGPCRLRRAA